MPRHLPPIVTLNAFEKENIPEPEPIIETFLERGSKGMLVGSSKSHKTWTLMDLAYHVSQPLPAWFGMKVHQCRVLYINFELQRWFFRERIRAINKAHGRAEIDNTHLDVWNLRGCSRESSADLTVQIQRHLEGKNPYHLTIVDPFYKFAGSNRVENAANDMAAVMASLDVITVDLDLAVMFAHHSPKGDVSERDVVDRGSGSGVFGRDPDAIIAISKDNGEGSNGEDYKAEFVLRNHPPKSVMSLTWEHPLMRYNEGIEPRPKNKGGRPKGNIEYLLLGLLNGQSVTSKEWEAMAKIKLDMSYDCFRKWRKKLVIQGDVIAYPNGSFSRPPHSPV